MSIRGRFDFRVAATSFLVPADWETNVRAVGCLVDEIELLFFDSQPPGSLPTPATVEALVALARDTGVTYNIHLPTDLSPGHADPRVNGQAAAVLDHVIALTAPLQPTAYIIHLPFEASDRQRATVRRWQENVRSFLSARMDASAGALTPRAVTVENLVDYPPAWVWDAVADLGVGFCFDVGHLLVQGGKLGQTFNRYKENIRLMHLHGVDGQRDHLPLTALNPSRCRQVAAMLEAFTGTVTIEVFNRSDFWKSIDWLTRTLQTP